MKVLVSGASIAGLATAYWMAELGHEVTMVEVARGIRPGGAAVDLQGETVNILKRMGIFDAVRANRLRLERVELKDANDRTVRTMVIRTPGAAPSEDAFEIERSAL